jgi:hypothetical protein
VVRELCQIVLENKAENPAVSVKALHLLGLEVGMFAQRKIVEKKGAKGLSDYSDAELQAIIDGRSDDDHEAEGGGGNRFLLRPLDRLAD